MCAKQVNFSSSTPWESATELWIAWSDLRVKWARIKKLKKTIGIMWLSAKVIKRLKEWECIVFDHVPSIQFRVLSLRCKPFISVSQSVVRQVACGQVNWHTARFQTWGCCTCLVISGGFIPNQCDPFSSRPPPLRLLNKCSDVQKGGRMQISAPYREGEVVLSKVFL